MNPTHISRHNHRSQGVKPAGMSFSKDLTSNGNIGQAAQTLPTL
jgi:hypothetical protein